MKVSIPTYVLVPMIIGFVPAFFIFWASGYYLASISSFVMAIVAFSVRHFIHKKVKSGDTPFNEKDNIEQGYTVKKTLINKSFKIGNLISFLIISGIFIGNFIMPNIFNWVGVFFSTVVLNVAFGCFVNVFLIFKKLPITVEPIKSEQSETLVHNAFFSETMGCTMFDKI